MAKVPVSIGVTAMLVAAAFAQHSHMASGDGQAMHSHRPTGDADGVSGAITGYVRDIACLLRNPKAGAATTALTKDCLNRCIRGGSPVAILAEDGSVYVPISDKIPDSSAHSRLLPFAGLYVKAQGKLFERGGLHAISIEKIEVISRPIDSKIPEL